jgi:predicted dehydrogenase
MISVNHLRRWDKAHQQIREFLAARQLGEVHNVTVTYTHGIFNFGSHIADLLRFFFGEVYWVRGFDRLKEGGTDPTLSAFIEMKQGPSCVLNGCSRAHYTLFEWDIVGASGRIRIEDFGYRTRLWRLGPHPELRDRQVFIDAPVPFAPGLHGMMIAAVDDLVRCMTQGGNPFDTGRDGLAALEITTAIKQSAVNDGERVDLPLVIR